MTLHLKMVCVIHYQVYLYVCHALGQYIVALEANFAMFKTMLELLADSIDNTMSKEQP
jgi:hypothetical protein